MTRLLILTSSIFLGIGLVAPTMTIYPKAGELSWLMEMLDPKSMKPVTYSIAGIIVELAEMKDWFLVAMLTMFSIFFPVAKLYIFWLVSSPKDSGNKTLSIYKIGSRLGKFSMAEVFVLSLLLISLKTLPGGTEVNLEYGCMIYFLSVIFSIFSSLKIESSPNYIGQ
jgi:uncharacterized paraquat-inducible protein A|tara:strand:- start:235 stop:735 length:501 start_codon:yes stop_codon:yes gene_type:complete